MSNLNNELNNLNDDFVKFNLNKQNINLANNLNGQLSKLDLDYNNHKEFLELKNNISNDGSRNDINNRLNDIIWLQECTIIVFNIFWNIYSYTFRCM